MMLTDRAEEILETLWVETVENQRMPDLSVLRNDTAFRELVEQGYLSLQAEAHLTPKGLDEGRLCVRRHRLAEPQGEGRSGGHGPRYRNARLAGDPQLAARRSVP